MMSPGGHAASVAKTDNIEDDESWIDARFVVVFVKDGETLGSCKSFKMNIQEILAKYHIKRPEHMKHIT